MSDFLDKDEPSKGFWTQSGFVAGEDRRHPCSQIRLLVRPCQIGHWRNTPNHTERSTPMGIRFLHVLESFCVCCDYFCGRGCRLEISVYSWLLNWLTGLKAMPLWYGHASNLSTFFLFGFQGFMLQTLLQLWAYVFANFMRFTTKNLPKNAPSRWTPLPWLKTACMKKMNLGTGSFVLPKKLWLIKDVLGTCKSVFPKERPHQPTPTPHMKGDTARQRGTTGDKASDWRRLFLKLVSSGWGTLHFCVTAL